MSDKDDVVRRTFELSKAANEKLKTLPSQLGGITQFELVTILLEEASAQDPKLIARARNIVAAKNASKRKETEIKEMVSKLTPEEMEKALKLLGKR